MGEDLIYFLVKLRNAYPANRSSSAVTPLVAARMSVTVSPESTTRYASNGNQYVLPDSKGLNKAVGMSTGWPESLQ